MTDEAEVFVYNAEGLGQAVRYFREATGLTQAQLAEQAGLDRDYIIDLERTPTEQTKRLVDLLKLLGVRIVIKKADW